MNTSQARRVTSLATSSNHKVEIHFLNMNTKGQDSLTIIYLDKDVLKFIFFSKISYLVRNKLTPPSSLKTLLLLLNIPEIVQLLLLITQ